MKRLHLLLACLILAAACAMAGDNTTLIAAQELLKKAKTLADYETARNWFKSAYNAPDYVAAEHDEAIKNGISDCEAKISQYNAKITVNGSANPTVDVEAKGGPITLGVWMKQRNAKTKVKADSNADWAVVEAVSKDSITIMLAPNLDRQKRTATVIVSASGARSKVTITQGVAELLVSEVKFGNTDGSGEPYEKVGMPLITEQLRYLTPQFKISGVISPVKKTMRTRIYDPDKKLIETEASPEGYTDGRELNLWPGDTIVRCTSLGAEFPGSWPEGNYIFELYIDDKREAAIPFRIVSKGLTVWDVDFASADKKDRAVGDFGEPLYTEDVTRIKPRVYYCGAKERGYQTLYIKMSDKTGNLDTNKKSPSGYTYSTTVELQPGTNYIELQAWGSGKRGAYPPGRYLFEIWWRDTENGKDVILYKTYINVSSKTAPRVVTDTFTTK